MRWKLERKYLGYFTNNEYIHQHPVFLTSVFLQNVERKTWKRKKQMFDHRGYIPIMKVNTHGDVHAQQIHL